MPARRFGRWVRDVIADRGEEAPVPIGLERRADGGYALRLGLRAGFEGQDVVRIPIHRRDNPNPHPVLKEIHYCDVAGRTLEAANPYALTGKVAGLLEGIAPGRALPLCYFRAPAMDYDLPVYEDDGHIVSPVVGGPKLRARHFGGIRLQVTRYLQSAGYVHEPDEVVVGVVRPSDLKLVPPAATLRSLADREFWLPTVEGQSEEGPVIGALTQGLQLRVEGRRRVGPGPPATTAPAAPDILALLRLVRAELVRTRRAQAAEALYATDLRPEIWTAAEDRTEDAGTRLVTYLTDHEGSRLELVVRRTGAGDVAVALADRYISAFLEHDEAGLAARVGGYLASCGFLRFPEEVEIHAARAPRAEILAPEAIRTRDFSDFETSDAGSSRPLQEA
jgi:hypothetical protein